MDDKTFVATYVAQEAGRINDRLKLMLSTDGSPSEDEKDAMLADIEKTLARLQSAVSHLTTLAASDEEAWLNEMATDA